MTGVKLIEQQKLSGDMNGDGTPDEITISIYQDATGKETAVSDSITYGWSSQLSFTDATNKQGLAITPGKTYCHKLFEKTRVVVPFDVHHLLFTKYGIIAFTENPLKINDDSSWATNGVNVDFLVDSAECSQSLPGDSVTITLSTSDSTTHNTDITEAEVVYHGNEKDGWGGERFPPLIQLTKRDSANR